MKTHPEFYGWLILIFSYTLMSSLLAIVYHWKAIVRFVEEWIATISEIYNGTGKRWQDHG